MVYKQNRVNFKEYLKKIHFDSILAYHEGWGGYKNYKNNPKVIILAKKVKRSIR